MPPPESIPSRPSVIAIDGPVASGKTTVGLALARCLGYRFLDTGVMYRAVTRMALDRRIAVDEEERLAQVARELTVQLPAAGPASLPTLLMEGKQIALTIFAPDVEAAVSQVSMVKGVREELVGKQRALAAGGRIVMVGRDIGTVVLPDAPLKVFLLASPEERARRRAEERRQRGEAADYLAILEEVRRRDRLDSQRPLSPLKPAADARSVDTDHHSIEEVVNAICALHNAA